MRPVKPKAPADRATRQHITGIVSAMLASREGVLLGYLHGSYAEGKPFRDLDVAVYVSESALSDSPLSYELELESQLESRLRSGGISAPLDLRVLNRAPLSFRYEVIKSGIVVYVRDDDLRVDFEVSTISRYFDFAPLRREQLREVLGRGSQ
ncbi:MAG: nucleotidyltransferase domain-containing protein [Candidatus Bipolaricaulota bacterium]